MIVWSCGGGTQSAAIAALIVRGKLPKPDLAVIVDTEREKSGTWEYAEAVLIPQLASVGVTLNRVLKSAYATVDLWTGKDGQSTILPVFTTQGGRPGKLTTYCSGEWKRDVILRWLRAQGVKECKTWIGISVDEMRRMRYSRVAWAQNCYPLIEPEFGLMYRRSDCETEVRLAGWPDPPRSACWMCPNMGDFEWLEMKNQHPEDFARAVVLEREIQKKDPHAWLHGSCVPLDQVDFAAQRGLFDDRSCASGFCFV
jgi:hypothetical protein